MKGSDTFFWENLSHSLILFYIKVVCVFQDSIIPFHCTDTRDETQGIRISDKCFLPVTTTHGLFIFLKIVITLRKMCFPSAK